VLHFSNHIFNVISISPTAVPGRWSISHARHRSELSGVAPCHGAAIFSWIALAIGSKNTHEFDVQFSKKAAKVKMLSLRFAVNDTLS